MVFLVYVFNEFFYCSVNGPTSGISPATPYIAERVKNMPDNVVVVKEIYF